jgi:4'-phosphopantetheinyl transferase
LEITVLTIAPELTQTEFSSLLPFVSPTKRALIHRYRRYQDAQRTLLGDILARAGICRKTGLRSRQLHFSANRYGKPFLLNDPTIHFNISHAGRYVVCAIGDQPVGVDIEIIKPINLRIAERFFAPDETACILSAPEASQTERFFQIWTMKESRIKWEGKGLHKPLPSFSVFDASERETLAYHQVYHNGEAVCHVCTAQRDQPVCAMITAKAVWEFAL